MLLRGIAGDASQRVDSLFYIWPAERYVLQCPEQTLHELDVGGIGRVSCGNSLVAKLSSGEPGVVGSSPGVSTSPLTKVVERLKMLGVRIISKSIPADKLEKMFPGKVKTK